MMRYIGMSLCLWLTATALGQTTTPATTTTTAPAVKPVEEALAQKIPVFDALGHTVGDTFEALRVAAKMNLLVNWRSLEEAGIKKDTKVWLYLRDTTVEQAIRYTLEAAPVKDGHRLSYVVGENLVEVTTTAALNRRASVQLVNASRQLALTLDEKIDTRADREKKLVAILSDELKALGDTAEDRSVTLRGERLVINASPRSHAALGRLLQTLLTPTKPTAPLPMPPAMQKARKWLDTPLGEDLDLRTWREFAEKSGQSFVNRDLWFTEGKDRIRAMAGQTPATAFRSHVDANGVLLNSGAVRADTRVYDLRDIARRKAFKAAAPKPPLATLAEEIAKDAATTLDLKQYVVYEGLLVAPVTPEQHYKIAAHLESVYKAATR